YGFLSNANRKTKLLKCLRLTRTPIKPKVKLTGVDISRCPSCGGVWCQILTLTPSGG
ncbi:zf-TFIIB domain-containing protein, partial [Paenibacillus sp. DS2015]|uniref:zf-TFIIB domain-containing protein n=1 Tax=Paenibacillus sp. DS2015 TaxID=3373917 RepID=UPI003D1A9367